MKTKKASGWSSWPATWAASIASAKSSAGSWTSRPDRRPPVHPRARGAVLLAVALACDPQPAERPAETTEAPRPSDCEQLALQSRDEARAAWVFAHACEGELDPRGQARLLSAVDGPTQAAKLMERIGDDPERRGVALLIAGRLDAPPPERIDNPSSAVVFPIDASVLGQVGRAYRLMFAPGHPLSDRQWAHAYLAKVHLHALQSLPQEHDPTPAQVWLAGRALHHARRALGNVSRSPKRIRPFIAGLEPEFEALHERLDGVPHHGDPLLVAIERQRYRDERGEPLRISDVDRLTQQTFADAALERALAQDAADAWVEVVTEFAESRGLRLRKLPTPVATPEADVDGTTESTGGALAPELATGPSFAEPERLAHDLGQALDSAANDESKRIALADAAWVLRRRPDVAPLLADRRDALGELARRHLARRGAPRDALEFETEPEARRRIRFAATRAGG